MRRPHLLVLVDDIGGDLLADDLPEDGVAAGPRGLRLADLVSHGDGDRDRAQRGSARAAFPRGATPPTALIGPTGRDRPRDWYCRLSLSLVPAHSAGPPPLAWRDEVRRGAEGSGRCSRDRGRIGGAVS